MVKHDDHAMTWYDHGDSLLIIKQVVVRYFIN